VYIHAVRELNDNYDWIEINQNVKYIFYRKHVCLIRLSYPFIIIIKNYQNSGDFQSMKVVVPVQDLVIREDEDFLQYFGHSHGMTRGFL